MVPIVRSLVLGSKTRAVACLAVSFTAACARPMPPPAPALPLAAGPRGANVKYHFNRNALVASVRAGNGALVALTDSGNLLVFDPKTFAVVAERVPRSPATCLGPATADQVIVGLDDGRVVAVDLPSMKMRRVGAVDGRPAWIGRGPSGLLVAHGFVAEKPFGWRDRGFAALALDELATGRTIRLPFTATVFLPDSRGRLWLGSDHGEWGGRLAVLDLSRWALGEIDGIPHGVYGLTETADGAVLAYGGTIHMGMTASFVARVAANQKSLTKLYEKAYAKDVKRPGPTLPVSHLVALDGGRTWLVFAYDQVFETDARFTRWRTLSAFHARYQWGRPDAVGAYPAARSAHLLDEAPRRIAIATALDGWIELRAGTFVEHRLAGQLGSSEISGFGDWAGRITARTDDGDAWVLDGETWRDIRAEPPLALPETTKAKEGPQAAFRPRSDGKLFALFRDESEGWRSHPPPPALLVTALCDGDRCQILGQEKSTLSPDSAFVTPDNRLWALDERGLSTFSDGRWTPSAFSEASAGPPAPRTDRIISVVTARWHPNLTKGTEAALMWPGAAGAAPRLVATGGWQLVGLTSDGVDVATCGGQVFAAGSAGVGALNADTDSWSRFSVGGASSVRHLGCDREDRLWVAGYGLWKLEGDRAIPVTDLDGLLGGREIRALGRDTGAGLPVAIEDRGVAVLASRPAAPAAARREIDEGDLSRAAPDRQAVFVSVELDEQGPVVEALDGALRSAKAGMYAGWYLPGFRASGYQLFYGPDAGRMLQIIRPILERTVKRAFVIRRDGARGTPEQRIEIHKAADATR